MPSIQSVVAWRGKMDRVNLFNPFESKPPKHEDRLTWAFLVTLKYNPPLQTFLRDMVLSEIEGSELPSEIREVVNNWEPANISTQKKHIQIKSAPKLIISVLLTDDPIIEEIKVEWSDRNPKYDGIIEYPTGLILIIEDKPRHGDAWQEQLSPNITSFPTVDKDKTLLYNRAICLEWSKVLEGVLRFMNSKLAPFGSSEIASYFLRFVEDIHPNLTPYRTFRLCARRPAALDRRINKLCKDIVAIVMNIDSKEANCGYDYGGIYLRNQIAERIYFDCDDNQNLRVRLWPGNTVIQARNLPPFFRRKRQLRISKPRRTIAICGKFSLSSVSSPSTMSLTLGLGRICRSSTT